MTTTTGKGRRKVRVGRVVSDKMDKTVVVAVEWRRAHPLYRKGMRRITKFKAHDEGNTCHMGDVVRIMETHPLSKMKRWRVAEILERRQIPEVLPAQAVTTEELAAVQEVAPLHPAAEAPAVVAAEEKPVLEVSPEPEAVAEAVEQAKAPVEEALQEPRAEAAEVVEVVEEEAVSEEVEEEEQRPVAEPPEEEATREAAGEAEEEGKEEERPS